MVRLLSKRQLKEMTPTPGSTFSVWRTPESFPNVFAWVRGRAAALAGSKAKYWNGCGSE